MTMMRMPTFSQFQQNAQLISQQFDALNRLVIQASTFKKIQVSSEDPVLASQIKSQSTFLQNIQSFYNNGVLAQNRAQLFSSTIQNSLSVINDVQTQIKQVQSGILSGQNMDAIAEQLSGDLSLLLSYANTTDANGNYIFGGFSTNIPPYVQVNGVYQYQGSDNRSYIDIGQNVNALFYESGFTVFGDIFNGNGTFTINANSANTGSASTTAGNVVDQSAYVPDTYTLTFVTNSSGQLAYQVVGASSGQVVPPLPATIPADAPAYTSKAQITFNGINFSVDGTPNVGDNFTIQPSQQQNTFNTLQSLIQTIQSSSTTNQGIFNQAISQLSAAVSQLSSHLIVYESQSGTNSASINDQININASIVTNSTAALSGLEDVDIGQVASALMQKQLAIQATTDSYMKLQDTLMQILQL